MHEDTKQYEFIRPDSIKKAEWIKEMPIWAERDCQDKDLYIEVAKQIPAVQALIEDGVALDEIVLRNDRIGDCVRKYFYGNSIQVYKHVNSYVVIDPLIERMLLVVAAMEAGVDIPVYINEDYRERKKGPGAIRCKKEVRKKHSDLWVITSSIRKEIEQELKAYVKTRFDNNLEFWILSPYQKAEVAQIYHKKLVEIDDCADYYGILAERVLGIKKCEFEDMRKNKHMRFVIVTNWKKDEETGGELDGAAKGTRRMEIVRKGTIIDRVGGDDGKYFSPMDRDGNPYALKQRAIGAILKNEAFLEVNSCYHRYRLLEDFSKENFLNAIRRSGYDEVAKLLMYYEMDRYYCNVMQEDIKCDHPGEAYGNEKSDGVKVGVIDSMFFRDDGGAIQYIVPFSAKQLEIIGMIEEI